MGALKIKQIHAFAPDFHGDEKEYQDDILFRRFNSNGVYQ